MVPLDEVKGQTEEKTVPHLNMILSSRQKPDNKRTTCCAQIPTSVLSWMEWKLEWNCDDLVVSLAEYFQLPSFHLIFLIFSQLALCLTSMHLSHPQTKLNYQVIKWSNGIIYKCHVVICSSLYVNRWRMCTCADGFAANITTEQFSPKVLERTLHLGP